ncbi:hypothetical protein PMAYCL1PPCAC_27029, partial [Pristionchus mayeri]
SQAQKSEVKSFETDVEKLRLELNSMRQAESLLKAVIVKKNAEHALLKSEVELKTSANEQLRKEFESMTASLKAKESENEKLRRSEYELQTRLDHAK